MPSTYERDETVARISIPHYPARSPQPRLGAPVQPVVITPVDVSYYELIVTASIDLRDVRAEDARRPEAG